MCLDVKLQYLPLIFENQNLHNCAKLPSISVMKKIVINCSDVYFSSSMYCEA